MEMPNTLFQWLTQIGALTELEGTLNASTGKTNIIKSASVETEMGLRMPAVLRQLQLFRPRDQTHKLDSLKNSISPSARLYNWSLIGKELAAYGIRLQDDERSLIVAGDQQVLVSLLESIWKIVQQGVPKKEVEKKSKSLHPGPIDITRLNTKKELGKIENCLEFLLISLSRWFALQPKQSAGLLTDGSRYISHILIKGLKGDYAPVIGWLTEVHTNSKLFAELIRSEGSSAVEMVLNILKAGLYSKNFEIKHGTAVLLIQIARELNSSEFHSVLYSWLIGTNGGLEGILFNLQKSWNLGSEMVELLTLYSPSKLKDVLVLRLKKMAKDSQKYLSLISKISFYLNTIKLENQDEKNQLMLQYLETAIKSLGSEKLPESERSMGLQIVANIWVNNYELISEESANRILNFLKHLSVLSKSFQYFALAILFCLFEDFSISKKSYAKILYKTICELFFSLKNSPLAQTIIENIKIIFNSQRSIPIAPLLELWIQNSSEQLGLLDFGFLKWALGQSSRLSLSLIIQILDVLAKTVINDLVFAPLAIPLIVLIADRFREEVEIREVISKLIGICYNTLSTRKNNKKEANTETTKKLRKKSQCTEDSKENEQKIRNATIHIIIDLLMQLQELKISQLNELIRTNTLSTNYLLEKTQRAIPELQELLLVYGLPEELISEYRKMESLRKQEEQEKQRADKEAEEAAKKLFEAQKIEEMQKARAERDPRRSASLMKTNSTVSGSLILRHMALVPYNQQHMDAKQRVQFDLDRIKLMKQERQRIQQEKEEKAKKEIQQTEQKLQQAMFRRHLELGVVSKSQPDILSHIICKEGELETKTEAFKFTELWNKEEEELVDQESADYVIKKYNKLFQYLFSSYSGSLNVKKATAFDAMREMFETLSVMEYRKMLVDHNCNFVIKKEDLISLIKLINIKQGRSDLFSLNLEGFIESFLQLGVWHFRNRCSSCTPLLSSFNLILSTFEEAARDRYENTIIYTRKRRRIGKFMGIFLFRGAFILFKIKLRVNLFFIYFY